MYAEHYGFSAEPVAGAGTDHTITARPQGMREKPQSPIYTVNTKLAVIGEFLQDQLNQIKNIKQSMGTEEVKVDLETWLSNLLNQVREQAENSTTGGKSK